MFFAQSCYNKNMSAKDAPGEVNKNPNFDSPNITSAADEVMEMIDAEKAARKKAETVEIDGVPIDEKEVKFKAEDIKKKGKTEYFVNVEGAEQRKREAQRRAKLEAEEAKRRAKADDERVINELHKKAEQRKRENRAVEEKAKAEDNRVIGELHKKAEKRKKENRAAARKERAAKRKKFFQKNKKLFKIILIAIVALVVAAGIAVAVYFILNPPPTEGEKSRREEGVFLEQTIRDFDEVYEYYDSHPENTGDAYTGACKIAEEIIASAKDNKTKYSYILQYSSFIKSKTKDYDHVIDLINNHMDVAETDVQKFHFYSILETAYIELEQYDKANEYQKLMEGLDVNYDEEEQ